MAKKFVITNDGPALKVYRKAQKMNQSEFWQRFGVTQSGSSRYESGRRLPMPLKILMHLYLNGDVSPIALTKAYAAVSK